MTTNEIATTTGSALAITGEQDYWTDKQVAALRQLGVSNASSADLAVFFHQSQRTGLDPFARQIYMIERQGKQTIQTGIDGFRLIARRAVDHARETLGYEDTQWCGQDGKWVDVWLAREAPAAARVTVLRAGERFPAIATFSEYAALKRDGSPMQMWANKPALMLAKCAEALALRKAFPQDLSGLYTSDEMQQAANEREPQQARQQRSQPSIADALAQPEVIVDVDSLLAAIETADTKDALRGLWAQTAGLPEEGKALTRELITARLADLEAPAAETDPEPELVSEPTLDDAIDAEVVA